MSDDCMNTITNTREYEKGLGSQVPQVPVAEEGQHSTSDIPAELSLSAGLM